MSKKKIVVAAVPFSDNLGDGVISDNIAGVISRNYDAEVEICDISFREGVITSKAKDGGLSIFLSLPLFLRQLIVVAFFTLKYFRVGKSYYRRKLESANHILVGGGQLICDVDLNFPWKLYLLVREAEKANIPFSIISVGVAGKWSWLGTKIMGRVLRSKQLKTISVRDSLSRKHLLETFGEMDVQLLPDPALLSSKVVGFETEQPNGYAYPVKVGLGVADIDGLNYSSDISNAESLNSIVSLVEIVKVANEKNLEIELFTNGAIEDEKYLYDQVIPLLDEAHLKYSVAERCNTSEELVKTVRSYSLVIAYRLHANIIAHSFGIPTYAIAWDNKVASFFEYVDCSSRAYPNLSALEGDIQNILVDVKRQDQRFDTSRYETMYVDFIGQHIETK